MYVCICLHALCACDVDIHILFDFLIACIISAIKSLNVSTEMDAKSLETLDALSKGHRHFVLCAVVPVGDSGQQCSESGIDLCKCYIVLRASYLASAVFF